MCVGCVCVGCVCVLIVCVLVVCVCWLCVCWLCVCWLCVEVHEADCSFCLPVAGQQLPLMNQPQMYPGQGSILPVSQAQVCSIDLLAEKES